MSIFKDAGADSRHIHCLSELKATELVAVDKDHLFSVVRCSQWPGPTNRLIACDKGNHGQKPLFGKNTVKAVSLSFLDVLKID